MAERIWSSFQLAVFAAVLAILKSGRDLVVLARAGDVDDAGRITFSSVHRAKGLERDRAFLLADTFRSGGQEDNIRYVAITRARHELVYVEGEVDRG